MMQILLALTPEGIRENKADKACWKEVAKKVLVPTDVRVTEVSVEMVHVS